MSEAAHFRRRKAVAMGLEPAFQLRILGIVGGGFVADQKIHFLCQPPPDDRITVTQPQPCGFPHQRLFLHILIDDLLPVLSGRQPPGRASPDFFQPFNLGRADHNGPALLALPRVPEMVQSGQQQPDQDKMRDRITEYFHAIFPSVQAVGTYQMGEDHARSWIVFGKAGLGGTPARSASRVDQRQTGFSSTRT